MKNHESGHAKNVANFGKLVSFCTGYGADYNPSNSEISIEALTKMQTDSQNSIDSVNASLPAYNNAIAAREVAFKPLSKLITRVVNALKASDPGQEIINKSTTLVRKLQGQRASSRLSEEEKQEMRAQGKEINEISSSQFSYDNRINNLDKLIKLLGSIQEYNPNEEELKIDSLTKLLENLRAANDAVIAATTPLSNSRIARNDILYRNSGAGLVDKAQNVKAYIKSLYGASSPQYHQISGLRFKRSGM